MPKKSDVSEIEPYVLPSSNDSMKTFIGKFKTDMMVHIVDIIEFAINNDVPVIELFRFKDSDYVITISKREYEPNLKHINEYFKKINMIEMCSKIEKLYKLPKK